MERNQLVVAAVGAIIIILGAYFALSSGLIGGSRLAHVKIGVVPTGTAQLPAKLCFIGAEPIYPQGDGSRITFSSAFFFTNQGDRATDYPGSIYLALNNEVIVEAQLPQAYAPGALMYGGKKDFTFTKEFRGMQFTPERVYRESVDFEYKLIYCAAPCNDPLSEGKVIYTNSTRYCCKLPSAGITGGYPSGCGTT